MANDSGAAPKPSLGRRLRTWVRGHGPHTLTGGVIVAVVAAVAGAFVTGLFDGDGDDGAGGNPPAATSGQGGNEAQGGSGQSDGDGQGDGEGGSGGDGGKPACLGAGCQGRDAEDFACDDAQILAEKSRPIRLQLKYSPKCRAGWGKILEGEKGDQVTAATPGGKPAEATISYGHDHHTPMVPAEGRFTLTACAVPDDSEGAPRWERFCVKGTTADVQ